MSGPHAQFRTPSRPLTTRQKRGKKWVDVPVFKTDAEGGIVTKHGVRYNHDGTFRSIQTPVIRHVLDYRSAVEHDSPHAAGRIRPLNAHARARRDRIVARLMQAQKSHTVDAARFGAVFDEI